MACTARGWFLLVALLGLCAWGVPVRAEEPAPPAAPMVIVAEADTFVISLAPDRNQNQALHPYMPAFVRSAAIQHEALIRFNLSTVTAPVSKATLQLYAKACKGSCTVLHLPDAADGWGETTVTWTTRPITGETVATITPPRDGITTIDITTIVNAELASGGNRLLSVKLVGAVGDQVVFLSRECTVFADNAPQLILE